MGFVADTLSLWRGSERAVVEAQTWAKRGKGRRQAFLTGLKSLRGKKGQTITQQNHLPLRIKFKDWERSHLFCDTRGRLRWHLSQKVIPVSGDDLWKPVQLINTSLVSGLHPGRPHQSSFPGVLRHQHFFWEPCFHGYLNIDWALTSCIFSGWP